MELIQNCMRHSFTHSLSSFVFFFLNRCIRVIARNIDECNCENWDLSHLPSTIKTDLIQMNMKLSIGFVNELTFIRLLTPAIRQLMFRQSIVTDPMLKCIGERCQNLQELRIFDSKWDGRQLQLTTDGLIACMIGLSHVKAIQIAECDKVNDQLIEIIRENCPQLESLWLNDCKNVTDRSSEYLESMPLHDINLGNTSVSINRQSKIDGNFIQPKIFPLFVSGYKWMAGKIGKQQIDGKFTWHLPKELQSIARRFD